MVVSRNVVDLIGSYVEMPRALQGDLRHFADVWRDGVAMIKQACNVVETSSASVLFPGALVALLALRETEVKMTRRLKRERQRHEDLDESNGAQKHRSDETRVS